MCSMDLLSRCDKYSPPDPAPALCFGLACTSCFAHPESGVGPTAAASAPLRVSDSAIAGDSSGSSGESGAGAGVGGGAGAPSGGGTMGDATMTQGASGAGSGGVDKRAELSRINRRLAARAAAHVLLAPVHLMAASEGRGGQLMTGFRQDMEARRRIKSQMP